ncbi:M23 family metallopeptidase [Streptacidiphilus sp. PAMC 29251]
MTGAAIAALLTFGVPASAGAAEPAAAPAPAAARTAAAKPKAVAAPKPKTAAKAAAKPVAKPAPKPKTWDAPIPGAPMSEAYGVSDSGYAAGYHTGTDFAVDVGTRVDAVTAGTVVSAGWQSSYGNAVVLRLDGGDYALYAHLSAFTVHQGQRVTVGQQVARSGNTGNSTGPHMHFELRTSNTYGAVTNPLTFLRAHGVSDF